MQPPTAMAFRQAPTRSQKRVAPATHFKEWVGIRSLTALSTNAGAPPVPFQLWHRFKEAFSPELVEKAVNGSARSVRRLCDPFGGSGTSALAAQFLGIESVSIEVNPFLADLIESKVHHYEIRSLLNALTRVARRARRSCALARDIFHSVPETFLEPGRDHRWLFDLPVAEEIAHLRDAIAREEEAPVRRLFSVLLGGILVSFSNAVVSGKGRRYRRGWENRRANSAQLLPDFCSAVSRAIVEIDALGQREHVEATVLRGDSRELIHRAGKVDLVVSSPPYPNSFDYTDVYNIELWMLGHINCSAENQQLRRSTLSSHVQIRRPFAKAPASPGITRVMRRLRLVRDELWDEHLVDMVGGYFADLQSVLTGCYAILRPRGEVWLVVGDSQYHGVPVKVAELLAELAPTVGLCAVRTEPFRSMRISPQQGGNHKLAENLLVLRKV